MVQQYEILLVALYGFESTDRFSGRSLIIQNGQSGRTMVILSLVNDGLMVITLVIRNGRAMAIGILATAMAIWQISVL